MSTLEIVAVILNTLGVLFTVRRNVLGWPVGIVGVLLYAVLFYRWKLYDDMALQGVYVLTQFYGWRSWATSEERAGQPISPIPLRIGPALSGLVVTALCAGALGYLMRVGTDDAFPWSDATLTCFSLLATVWAARRHEATWWLWVVVDTAYGVLFLYRGNMLTAGLYGIFTALAVYGCVTWRQAASAPQ